MLMNLVAIIPLLVMLVIFIGQAIWVARDAMKKGEEFWWLWTIISVIVFPIGIIIYILTGQAIIKIPSADGRRYFIRQ